MGDMLGREVELEVTKIAHGGISVARHEGRVVFVADAIPGEVVTARITDDTKAKFWRAATTAVVTPSVHRQPHIWSEASVDRDPDDRPGGAEFGHITPDHQRELKRQVINEALVRMAGAASGAADGLVVERVAGNADGTGWRTRVSLHVDDRGMPGPYASRSHRVVAVTALPLAVPEIGEAVPLLQNFAGEERVDLVAPSSGGVRMIIGAQRPSIITERVGTRDFRLNDSGFWQVHRNAAQTLTSAVQEAIDEALFDPRAANLDLYGGVGLLAAAVGDRFGSTVRITSVESEASATDFAAENLADWVGASAVTARVELWVRQLSDASAIDRGRLRRATVVLDPPRSGAGAGVVRSLASVSPAQVIYVACDPVAFARDVATFAESGYALRRVRAFDLFPNTHHIECVGTLTRS